MDEATDKENSDKGLGGLLILGLLGYAAYKVLKTSGHNDGEDLSPKRLTTFEIYSIVNDEFYHIDDDEIVMSCLFLVIPDITGIKKEHYNDMLRSRIMSINRQIKSMISSGYEAFNPQISEEQLNGLLSFIRNDCYQEIKGTKFIAQLEGNLMSFIPGMKFMGKAKNANIDFKVITAIKRGLMEYFSALYVYGQSIDVAKENFKRKYIDVFFDSLD